MKDYKKYFKLPADPEEVYAALTNPATIQLWSGEPAVMSTEPGSNFALWDESITGTNLEFEPGKKIVQQWDFEDQEAPSIVTIKLHPDKELFFTGISFRSEYRTDHIFRRKPWEDAQYWTCGKQFFQCC